MKKSTFIKLRVARIILLALFCTLLFAQEKDKYGKYPADKPHPFISEYPPAIQKLDSIKSEYWRQYDLYKSQGLEMLPSDKFIKEYARSYISCYLYYSGIHKNSEINKYFKESSPIGISLINKFSQMPYPWGFLSGINGIVLGKVINDEILPKKEYPFPVPTGVNEYVLKMEVVDDLLNTFREDTILIRHTNSIYSYNEYENDYILATFIPGCTIQRKDSVQNIYTTRKPDEFWIVKDSIIYDPNNILKITGKHYSNFKNDLLNFIEVEGITK